MTQLKEHPPPLFDVLVRCSTHRHTYFNRYMYIHQSCTNTYWLIFIHRRALLSPLHSPHSNSYLLVGFLRSSNSTRCNDHCRVGDCSQQWEHNTTNDGCWQTQVQQQLGTVWSGGIENRKISHCVQTGEKSGVLSSVPSEIVSQQRELSSNQTVCDMLVSSNKNLPTILQ